MRGSDASVCGRSFSSACRRSSLLLDWASIFLGGRYISTDNAYVGAQKVLITPDISGKIVNVAIREGQHVNSGDELFTP